MPVDVKKMIAETFVEMARHRSVDKITVKDLVEACHISRQTFYYHFQDILEVIEWSMQREMQRMLEASLQAERPEEALKVFASLSEDQERRGMLRRLLDSQRRDQISKIIVHAVRTYLQEMFHSKQPGLELKLSRAEWEVMLDFYAFGLTGLLLKYCVQEHMDPDVLSHCAYRLLSGELFRSDSI